MVDQTGDVTGAPKTAAAAEGSVAGRANEGAGTVASSEATAAGGDSADADVDIGPAGTPQPLQDISFTVVPMEVDAAEFADAGFATADDFPVGHFDEPAEEEELAQRIVAAGRPTHPTNDANEAALSAVRDQIQELRANDAARGLDIDDIRCAGQLANTRLDDTDIKMKDLEASYTALSLEQDQNKVLLNNVVKGMSDFIRYFTDVQSTGPASKFPPVQHLPPSPGNNMGQYTNSPSYRQLAQELFPEVYSNVSHDASIGNFDSASHAGPSRTPVSRCTAPIMISQLRLTATQVPPDTRRMSSTVLPRTGRLSGVHPDQPRVASAMVTPSQSSDKGKAKVKMNAGEDDKDDEDEDEDDEDDDIVDDPEADGKEDDDIENSQSQGE